MGSFITKVGVPAVMEWKEMVMSVKELCALEVFSGSGPLSIRKTPIVGVKY